MPVAVAIQHPVLRPDAVQFRGYQANLARVAGDQDTLVVLPTGMGKTIVALLTLADAWKQGARHILFMAPTRPLVEQHAAFLQGILADDWEGQVTALTGTVAPKKRQDAYAAQGIVVATPQVIHNDLVGGRIDRLPDWVIYDECHRAVGEYPYVFIGKTLRRQHPEHRRMGLTASPGHDVAKIDEVRKALGLRHVEIRTPHDPDVSEYIQDVQMEWEALPLPASLERVSKRLQEALAERTKALKSIGFLKGTSRPNKRVLLETAKQIQAMLRKQNDPDPNLYTGLSLQAQAMKLLHALEQAQTQGAAAFVAYMEQMRKEADGPNASKATRVLVQDRKVNEAYQIARHDESENPKMGRVEGLLQEQLEKDPESLTIVFTHFRSTCEAVVERLAKIPGARPVMFVGQAKRGNQQGLTQKQQAEILDQFRNGEYNILVATSVAEEGLDIPATDLVVFYEPIPSEIRSIQRRGRTGRNQEGRVVVLMTRGTQDEAAHWSAKRKENQMVKELHGLRATLTGRPVPVEGAQKTLDSIPDRPTRPAPRAPTPSSLPPPPGPEPKRDTVKVVCDSREQAGGVVRHLHEMGADIDSRSLEVADFVCSDRVAVERKTGEDFVQSLLDGRLFEQLHKLKEYPRPVMILEGDVHGTGRNLSHEALAGAMASISVDFGIPLMQTRDPQDTARLVLAMAKREQIRSGRGIAIRPAPPGRTDDEWVLHVLAGFPGINQSRAEALLKAFGTLDRIFQADEAGLAGIDGIGPKTASRIREILQHHRDGS